MIGKGCAPLASRHGSLNMSETRDVIQVLRDFEEHTACSVGIALAVVGDRGREDLFVTATAWGEAPAGMAQPVLASVSVRCSSTNLRNLKDVVTHVMYLLDGKLAWLEMQGNPGDNA